jgi:hypothetical protein
MPKIRRSKRAGGNGLSFRSLGRDRGELERGSGYSAEVGPED